MARHFVAWWILLLVVWIANATAQTAEPSIAAFVTATGGALHFKWTISTAWISTNTKDDIKSFLVVLDGNEIGNKSPDTTSYDLYGLTGNTEYTLQVKASFIDNSSASPLYSDVIVATTLDQSAPAIPTSPTELAVGGGFVQVSVQPPLDSGGTDLSRVTVVVWRLSTLTELLRQSQSPENSDSLIYDIYGLDALTSYRISAFATNEGGISSSESNALNVVTTSLQIPGPCPSPTILSTTGASIVLKLNPPLDDGGDRIRGYNVYMTTEAVVDFVEVASTFGSDTIDTVEILSSSELENQPLLPETRYIFKAVAVNLADICISVPSSLQLADATNATTAAASVPGPPPSPYFLKASGGMITMSLIKPFNMQGAELTGFLITITNDDGTSFTSSFETVDNVTYDAAPLKASTSYSISAAVTTNLGTSSYSTSTIMNTTASSTPTPPRDIKVMSVTGSSAMMEWSLPRDSGGVDITGYTIFLMPLGSQEERYALSSSTLLKDLIAETLYTVKVIATNADAKNSSRSVGATFKTQSPTPPSEPQGISSIFASGGAIEVAWNPPLDRGGGLLSSMGYKITIFSSTSCFDKAAEDSCSKCNSVKLSVEQHKLIKNSGYTYRMPCGRIVSAKEPRMVKGTTSAVFNGLNYSSTYYFGVQAINQAGRGDCTVFQGLRTTSQTPPSYPSNLRQLSATGGSVQLTWDAPLDTGGGPVVGYYVYRNYELLTPGYITPPFTDCGGMMADTAYVYGVTAVNASLAEGAMTSTKISTETFSTPLPPTLSLTGRMYNSLQVSVIPPCDTGGEGSLSYQYVVKYAGVEVEASTFNCCNFVVQGLEPNTQYVIFARVVNILSSASLWAEATYKTTSGIPLSPVASMLKVGTYSAVVALGLQPFGTEILSFGVSLFQDDVEIQQEIVTCGNDDDVGQYICPASYKLETLAYETEYKISVHANGPLGSSDSSLVWFNTSGISTGVFGMSKTDYSADKDGVIRTVVHRSSGTSGSIAVGVNMTEPDTESANVTFTIWNDDSAELLPSLVAVGPFGVDLAGQHVARLHTDAWQQPGFVSFSEAPSGVLEDESFAMVNVNTGGKPLTYSTLYMRKFVDSGSGTETEFLVGCKVEMAGFDNPSCTVSNLLASTSYEVYTVFTNAMGESPEGERAVFQTSATIDLPSPPLNLRAPVITAGNIELQWDAPDDLGGASDVVGYIVYQKYSVATDGYFTLYDGQDSKEQIFTARGLKRSSTYAFAVVALNDASFCADPASYNAEQLQLVGVLLMILPVWNWEGTMLNW
ncbi:Titin [Phytophthora ramorum]|uniref:Titin n=1 Tax=Phytophthora ramorum TaxID=164328 RepID=UPI0030AE0E6F|nr:Titin [Phytophthora ramorum]